ncbi:MAG: cyclase [Chloroflexi bacterium]|nr:MAG: cyclase [Chloroflexota bacterium]
MSYIIVKHKVADYARWKPLFDADGANRQAGGSKGGQLFRSADDPNEVVMLLEWDLEQARQFRQCEALSAKLQEAGVLGPPDFYFLEEVEQLSR